MSMFKQVADVQTADMLNLPVPKLVGGKPINVALPPSPPRQKIRWWQTLPTAPRKFAREM